jgi:hypothetical protein
MSTKTIIDWRFIGGELVQVPILVKVDQEKSTRTAWNKGKPWKEIYTSEMMQQQLENVRKNIKSAHVASCASRRGKPAPNSKPVLMICPKRDHIVGRFYSSREAQIKTGFRERSIRRVCTGERKTLGGFFWKYE